MRNLKRVLSLAMASVMLLGMMVIGAGAVDYKDGKDVSYNEAVDVMSAIGVFQGDNNGNFNPKGNLTREQAAKIITYMLMGKEAADGLTTSKAPFTDVAATRWSAGSIAYCVANGIVAGDGQGNFMPEATVTGSQLGKMLLGALGYQAETEGMVGAGWEINVAKLVKRAELNKGILVGLSRALNREQAAQMAFNTLNGRTVEYIGGTKVTTSDGTTIVVGGTRDYTGNVGSDNFYKINFPALTNNTANVVGSFGRPASNWKLGVKTIGVYDATPTFTYTATTTATVMGADLGDYAITNAPVVANSTGSIAANVSSVANVAAITGNGRTVEVYTGNNAVSKVVVIDTYITTISSISTVNKEVRLSGYTAITESGNKALYTVLAAMKKGDNVLVNVDASHTVKAVSVPTVVSGTYTAANNGGTEITVGGTKYKFALNGPAANSMTLGSTYDLYLDANGYVIKAEVQAAAATTFGFLTGAVVEGNVKNGQTLVARIVLADGTQKWVDVTTVNGTAVNENNIATSLLGELDSAIAYAEKADGTYSIKTITDGTALVVSNASDLEYTTTGATITNNKVNFLTGTLASAQGNNSTLFLVKQGNGSYKAYQGVKNVPSMTGVAANVVIAKDTTVASLVVVTVSSATSSTSSDSYAYITRYTGSEYVDGNTLYSYEAIVKGEIVTLKSNVSTIATAGLYQVNYDGNGIATALNNTATEYVHVTVDGTKVVSGVVKFGNGTINKMAGDDMKVFVVLKSGAPVQVEASDIASFTQAGAIGILKNDFVTTLIVFEAP